jgi:hypothetical protein
VLTIFAAPKPFRDHVGVIQRNAIRSWTRLHAECQVILCGDEDGCGDVAAELGVDWIPDVVRNEYGTPLVSSVFRQAERHAANRLLCYANADLILFPDLTDAALLVAAAHPRFLAVSEAVDLEVTTLLTGADELDVVRRQARSAGAPRGRQWIDLSCSRATRSASCRTSRWAGRAGTTG